MTGPAHGLQRHPCGCVNDSLICPCTATLPTTTKTQRIAGVRMAVRDQARVGNAAQPARHLEGDDR